MVRFGATICSRANVLEEGEHIVNEDDVVQLAQFYTDPECNPGMN